MLEVGNGGNNNLWKKNQRFLPLTKPKPRLLQYMYTGAFLNNSIFNIFLKQYLQLKKHLLCTARLGWWCISRSTVVWWEHGTTSRENAD